MVKKGRRWTEDELRDLGCGKHLEKVAGKGRYGNVKKIEEDGIRFDSKREYLRWLDLKLLVKAGEIRDLRVHPKYPITIGGIPIMVSSNQHNKWDRHLTYEADFVYEEPAGALGLWRLVIEDVKMQSGHRTGVYKLKRALMRAMGYDIKEY
jgi:hypothetical protein